MTVQREAHWPVVNGDQYRDRRVHLNLTQAELAAEAGLKSYETVGAVEKGEGSAGSRRRIEAALVRLENESGVPSRGVAQDQPDVNGMQMMEFEVTGDFGVRVVVKGPVDNAAELEASVVRLIRDMRSSRGHEAS